MLIGIGKDFLVHVLEVRSSYSWHYWAAFTAIITTLSRGHGMALFLVLFNRCRVPLFPVRESPSALSGRARILMSSWLFKRLSLYPLYLHLFESPDPGSSLVLFQVQKSLFNKDLFLPHFSFC